MHREHCFVLKTRDLNSFSAVANRPVNSTYKPKVFNKFLNFLTNLSVSVAADITMNSNAIVCGKIPCGKDSYNIETSQLICSADQLGGLCMVRVFEKSDFQKIYYVTDFCNILQHIVKLKVIQTFKKLLKSEGVNKSDLINLGKEKYKTRVIHILFQKISDCKIYRKILQTELS